jgi:hypothetical protein
MKLASEDLVIRARAGDQVAIATIALVGQNADRGLARAIKSRRFIRQAISKIPLRAVDPVFSPFGDLSALHPKREAKLARRFAEVVVGADGPEPYAANVMMLLPTTGWRGVVMLANGPSLLNSGRARALALGFANSHERNAFCLARRHAGKVDSEARARMPVTIQKAMQLGDAFGLAQKIQAVRLPGSRISDYDPNTGWELGE